MLNDLLLLSGNDIPFVEAQVNIHQPSIKEIACIGEESFFIGCELLGFSKKSLSMEEQAQLTEYTDLDFFLMMFQGAMPMELKRQKESVDAVLMLLFPDYEVSFSQKGILLQRGEEEKYLDNSNFPIFQKTIKQLFNLNKDDVQDNEYNPSGDLAKSIVKKLEERKRKLAEQSKSGSGKINILCRYVSILSVGQQKDMNSLLQYTVYQLFDEFQRYELKMQADYNFQARMAGAKDLPEIEDWMKDIHS